MGLGKIRIWVVIAEPHLFTRLSPLWVGVGAGYGPHGDVVVIQRVVKVRISEPQEPSLVTLIEIDIFAKVHKCQPTCLSGRRRSGRR